MRYQLFAIDLDGTIVEESFPEIGQLKPHAIRVMKRIKENGGKIAIWTSRSTSQAGKVQKFLAENNIPYDVYNEPFPEIKEKYEATSRKVFADIYIDDRAYGVNRKIDWLEIEKHIFSE